MKSEQLVLALIAVVVGFLGWQTYQQFSAQRPVMPQTGARMAAADAPFEAITKALLPAPPATAAIAAPPKPPPTAEAAPLSLTYASKELHDPFASVLPQEAPHAKRAAKPSETPKETPLPTLHLQGLMYGGGEPRAIIDGQIVGEGDRVGTVEVVEIRKDGVLLSHQKHAFLLKTGSPAKKISDTTGRGTTR